MIFSSYRAHWSILSRWVWASGWRSFHSAWGSLETRAGSHESTKAQAALASQSPGHARFSLFAEPPNFCFQRFGLQPFRACSRLWARTIWIWIFHPLSWSSSIRMVSAASARVDSAGFSPLHYAALNGDPSLVQDLLLRFRQIQTKAPGKPTQFLDLNRGFHLLPFPAPSRTMRLSGFWSLPKAGSPAAWLFAKPLHCCEREWTIQKPSRFSSTLVARLSPNSFGVTPLESAVSGRRSLEALEDLLRHSIDHFHGCHSGPFLV